MKPKRAGIYLRVSTDDQTTTNQELELVKLCLNQGWEVARVFRDEGISGSKGRDKRPGFDALHKAIVKKDIDIVVVWSVDRLGRSLQDLVAFLSELQAKSVDLFILQQGLDTTTPGGRAMFQMLGVFAEFERSLIQERVRSGIARAKQLGTKSGKAIGRPTRRNEAFDLQVIALRQQGLSLSQIATKTGLSKTLIHNTLNALIPR